MSYSMADQRLRESIRSLASSIEDHHRQTSEPLYRISETLESLVPLLAALVQSIHSAQSEATTKEN